MTMHTAVALLLVLGGVAAAAWGYAKREERRVHDLRQVLELSYLDEHATMPPAELSSLLARTGAVAERALQGTTVLARLRDTIERSQWKISPGELVALSLGAGVGGVLIGLLAHSPLLALVLLFSGLFGPAAAAARAVRTRLVKFEAQLPDILDMVAAAIEAGASVSQALEVVVAEVDEPSATEFARVLAATRLGTTLDEALQAMSERLGSRDLAWTVQAIQVQQRTGGRLAEVLRIVAGVMRSREEVRREITALTAEGRLSAYVLTGLPIAFLGFLALVRPSYLHPLYTNALGIVMLGFTGVLMVGAYIAMTRIVKIEV